MTNKPMGYRDVVDSSSGRELARLRALEASYDPGTVRWLDQLGVAPGWRCLEIGAGGGSIARWLADHVGPTGHVVATDLRIEQLASVAAPNLEIRVHDIVADPLDDATYDLVHLRFVLQHLGENRAAVLAKLVTALRPGGWLLVEDGDWTAFEGSLSDEFARWSREATRLSRERLGIDVHPGRRLLSNLLETGLTEVGSEGRVIMMGENGSSAEPFAAWIEQIMPALEPHGLPIPQGDALLRFMRSPEFCAFGLIQLAGWGRCPR